MFKNIFLLILLGVVWGSGYSIARYCTTHGVPPLGYSFWQSVGPAVILSGLLLIKQQRFLINGPSLRYYLFCGLIGLSIPNTIMYFGASHLTSAILTILVNITPLLIYPLSLISRQELFSLKRFSILIAGIIGIFIIILNQQGVPTLDNIPWTAIVLLTPICFAACATFVNPLKPQNMSVLNSAVGMLVLAAILLIPLVLRTGEFYKLTWNVPSGLILLEIALSSLGYVLFFKVLSLVGPVYYSLVSGVVSLTGLFWGFILFGEVLGLVEWLGVILILMSIITLNIIKTTKVKNDKL